VINDEYEELHVKCFPDIGITVYKKLKSILVKIPKFSSRIQDYKGFYRDTKALFYLFKINWYQPN